ncbi:MAG: hypothetical protein WKF84_00470 [Pyrinomonadaceae bacterium]
MIFRFADKDYHGATAVDIVQQLAADARGFVSHSAMSGGNALNEFLQWSLKQFGDRLPPREMDVSDRLNDEALARNYLLMRDEYQLGELTDDKRT